MKVEKRVPVVSHLEVPKSPIDLWRLMGGKAQRIKSQGLLPPDSLLAVYKDRFTYTFILGREVASIHFDKNRSEIFFKGHNIRNLDLNPSQIEALEGLKTLLKQDERGAAFFLDYQATLGRLLADNK